ncbi:MAG: ATP-dependent RNA helicase DbpA [Pseudomonadales bacterium]|nr:ATP-dependent RNA helicase DbpA [Pseudomonadales bacterium]
MSDQHPENNNTAAFAGLNLDAALLANLEMLNFQTMTPVQALALPEILQGRDLIAQARTGSGKTAAFGLGILQRLNVKHFRVQALVLCPTRELADQVARDIRQLGRQIHNIKVLTLCGGVPFGPQKGSLEHGAHIVVGTPGRIEEHLRKGNLSLQHLTQFVLDEADRMLDMGFGDVIEQIRGYLPAQRQTLLFSATYPENIRQLASKLLKQPVSVEAPELHDDTSIRERYIEINSQADRSDALIWLLQQYQPTSALVFCNTRQSTEEVASKLSAAGFSALPIHGDLEQRDRDVRLVKFTNHSITVLVATDVAARGLDIEALDLVVNYHLPNDPEVHTHRIGRTGRAGQRGIACSLFHSGERHKTELLASMSERQPEQSTAGSPDTQQRGAPPAMITLQIDGGKKHKLRPGDIVGALTGEGGIDGTMIGKISTFDTSTYVAVERNIAGQAVTRLNDRKIKGRKFRARKV